MGSSGNFVLSLQDKFWRGRSKHGAVPHAKMCCALGTRGTIIIYVEPKKREFPRAGGQPARDAGLTGTACATRWLCWHLGDKFSYEPKAPRVEWADQKSLEFLIIHLMGFIRRQYSGSTRERRSENTWFNDSSIGCSACCCWVFH